jgi:hypothetical protein
VCSNHAGRATGNLTLDKSGKNLDYQWLRSLSVVSIGGIRRHAGYERRFEEPARHYVRKKVPKWLERPTAEVLGNGKSRQVFLKRSLDTKDLRDANIRAKPVLIKFDRMLAQAEA